MTPSTTPLLEEFAEVEPLTIRRAAKEIRQDLELFNLGSFVTKINMHFSKVAYHLFNKAQEGFYQAIFFTFLETSDIKTKAEIATNIGRIDLICEMPNTVCVFELKLDKTADLAFKQAESKKYIEQYSLYSPEGEKHNSCHAAQTKPKRITLL